MEKRYKILIGILALFVILRFIGRSIDTNTPNEIHKEISLQAKTAIPQDTIGTTKEFVVTPAKAKQRGLPPTNFSLKYTEHSQMDVILAEVGKKNLNYILFDRYDAEDNFLESFGIGHLDDAQLLTNQERLDLLDSIATQIIEQAHDGEVISLTTEGFASTITEIAKFTREQVFDNGTHATYTTMMVISPHPALDQNSVLLIFNARQGVGTIEHFDDFGKKGYLLDIFKSFAWE